MAGPTRHGKYGSPVAVLPTLRPGRARSPLREAVAQIVERFPGIPQSQLYLLLDDLVIDHPAGVTASTVEFAAQFLCYKGELTAHRAAFSPLTRLFPERTAWIPGNRDAVWLLRHPVVRDVAFTVVDLEEATDDDILGGVDVRGWQARAVLWDLSRRGLVRTTGPEGLYAPAGPLTRLVDEIGWMHQASRGASPGRRELDLALPNPDPEPRATALEGRR